jgi:hypothetical protein
MKLATSRAHTASTRLFSPDIAEWSEESAFLAALWNRYLLPAPL